MIKFLIIYYILLINPGVNLILCRLEYRVHLKTFRYIITLDNNSINTLSRSVAVRLEKEVLTIRNFKYFVDGYLYIFISIYIKVENINK